MDHQACCFTGSLILPDQVLARGMTRSDGSTITQVGPQPANLSADAALANVLHVDAGDGYISPGFVDIHVHGGGGADFMDGTPAAFATVLLSHLRHGTTSLLPTSTAARHDQILRMLELVAEFQKEGPGGPPGARVLGAHFYGPYFNLAARGCHPGAGVRQPLAEEFEQYLNCASAICTATIAPELPGAEEFARACAGRGVRLNAGHSHASFDQVARSLDWGIRHVDHLFCAMSDKAHMRHTQTYPMRGGLLEATLFFDELSTEVIADGKHLAGELLRLALKIKGPDRLALVTDCNRALDMPEGNYVFGPIDGGEAFLHQDGVGIMPDRSSLASGATGLDHAVRTFRQLTGSPLHEVVRMASLTPARIAGYETRLGSLEPGKLADILVLDPNCYVRRVFLAGKEVPL